MLARSHARVCVCSLARSSACARSLARSSRTRREVDDAQRVVLEVADLSGVSGGGEGDVISPRSRVINRVWCGVVASLERGESVIVLEVAAHHHTLNHTHTQTHTHAEGGAPYVTWRDTRGGRRASLPPAERQTAA